MMAVVVSSVASWFGRDGDGGGGGSVKGGVRWQVMMVGDDEEEEDEQEDHWHPTHRSVSHINIIDLPVPVLQTVSYSALI